MTNPKENTDLREEDDKYRRAFEAATDLYKIDGQLSGELATAISHLRQFINEECSPKDQVTSQLIYDLLYPTIEKLVHQARVDELKKASTQLDYSEPGEWFDARIKELESKEEA